MQQFRTITKQSTPHFPKINGVHGVQNMYHKTSQTQIKQSTMIIENINVAPHFLNFQFKTCIKTKKIPIKVTPHRIATKRESKICNLKIF